MRIVKPMDGSVATVESCVALRDAALGRLSRQHMAGIALTLTLPKKASRFASGSAISSGTSARPSRRSRSSPVISRPWPAFQIPDRPFHG
jgi:hypothetical protein